MKAMKKLMALALVLTMVLALAISASAASIEITNQQTEKFDEEVYQLATYVSDSAGNSWYKANEVWKPFLSTYFNIDSNGFLQGKIDTWTEAAFATALKEWMGNDSNYTSVAATKVADLNNVAPGYYALITKDKSTGKIAENVAVAGLTSDTGKLEIRQKNVPEDLPKLNKTMSGDGTVYNVGDIREFTVTLLMEEGDTTYTIIDTMTGLELADSNNDGTVDANDITVSAVDGATIAKTDITANSFKVTITFDEGKSAVAYQVVTVTYKAVVTEAGIVSGIGNKAEIAGTGKTSETTDKTKEITVKKTDGTIALDGAEFELYVGNDTDKTLVPLVYIKDTVNGDYYRPATAAEIAAVPSVIVPVSAGTATIRGLDPSTTVSYYLKETKAPAGYIAINNYISVSSNEVTVANTKASELPSTGGMGTTMFYVVGAVLVVAAVALVATKKRYAAK